MYLDIFNMKPFKEDHPQGYPSDLYLTTSISSTPQLMQIPFAQYLEEVLKPDSIIQPGILDSVYNCTYCNSVRELELISKCYAVDSYSGDPHQGNNSLEIKEKLHIHHDTLYSSFPYLIPLSFEEAVNIFLDRSIDLLHINRKQSKKSIKHELEI